MKLSVILVSISSASAVVISSRQTGALKKGAQTLVLKEVGGVPGNECITFRNNGTVSSNFYANTLTRKQAKWWMQHA